MSNSADDLSQALPAQTQEATMVLIMPGAASRNQMHSYQPGTRRDATSSRDTSPPPNNNSEGGPEPEGDRDTAAAESADASSNLYQATPRPTSAPIISLLATLPENNSSIVIPENNNSEGGLQSSGTTVDLEMNETTPTTQTSSSESPNGGNSTSASQISSSLTPPNNHSEGSSSPTASLPATLPNNSDPGSHSGTEITPAPAAKSDVNPTHTPILEINNHDGADTSNNFTENKQVNESSGSDSEPYIFKVHNLLRNVNNKAYEPANISIGPYHRGKPHLKLMDTHKLRFRDMLLQRKNEQVSTYLDAIIPEEEKARKSYAESIAHIESDEFVEMLVLDGIFIIELFWKFKKFVSDSKIYGPVDYEGNNIRNDPLFKMPWALSLLQRDLMLFENQLPFFILVKLFELIAPPGDQQYFNDLAIEFFKDLFPGYGEERISNNKHLLDLIHRKWGSQTESDDANRAYNMDNLELIRCSTKLKEVGIKLLKIENKVSFDIEFENGELQIPVLTLECRTESLLRNLIAYEQYCGDSEFHIVTDYVTFFSCLIKTKEDVARLTRHGILRSFIDDDKVTTRMFSTILDYTNGPNKKFRYGKLFQRVNEHCKRPSNRYMAILRRDYMNSPWGILSVLTVIALLLLAILEVVFQILSWNQQNHK